MLLREETMMRESLGASCLGMLIWSVTVTMGCSPVPPVPAAPSHPVSISTFQDAAGKWTGVLITAPRSRQDDWITLIIREDGTYQFQSVRTIGIMQGKGMFTLTGGKLRAENEEGWGVATLYKDDDRRMLKIEGVTKDGTPYSADLHPK